MKLLNHPLNRSHKVFRSLWDLGCWCWLSPTAEGGVSSSRAWLRGFLQLKLVTFLLFPHRAVLGLVLGCPFSFKALLLLRSPHVSTKPCTVFLCQLALTDGLLVLHWTLKLGHKIALCFELDLDSYFKQDIQLFWFKEALSLTPNHLLDAYLLASLLFLGLLGFEATLVSRWPLQTRAIRTSKGAQLWCTLVWALVLSELMFVVFSELQTPQSPPSFVSQATLSFFLRRALWLGNLWIHYNLIYNKPQKRRSSFH